MVYSLFELEMRVQGERARLEVARCFRAACKEQCGNKIAAMWIKQPRQQHSDSKSGLTTSNSDGKSTTTRRLNVNVRSATMRGHFYDSFRVFAGIVVVIFYGQFVRVLITRSMGNKFVAGTRARAAGS